MSAVAATHRITIKRAYEPAARGDGIRILVDRLWPRGLRKDDAHFDEWRQDLSPSTALRKFYGHRPELGAEFARWYRPELRRGDGAAAVSDLVRLNRRRNIPLLPASRDLEHSEVAVLAKHLAAVARRAARTGDSGRPAARPGSIGTPTRGATR
jgi:uncharacterized protein YeaO (DUF488 family)